MKNSYLVLHEKTLCNRREGVFSEQADEGEGDSGPVREGFFSEQEDEGEGDLGPVKYCRFVRPAYC